MLATAARSNPLGLREDVHLSRTQRRQLEALEQYDMEFVTERLANKGLLAEEVIPAAITGYKRFIALTMLGYRGLDVPSEDVDEVWHTHILFTREYADFCDQLGAGFIHHVPYTRRSTPSPANRASYQDLFVRHFDAEDAVEVACSKCHSNCQSCHQCHGCGISATPVQSSNARATCHGNCHSCGVA